MSTKSHTFYYNGYKVTITDFKVEIEAPKEISDEIFRRLQAEGFIPEDTQGIGDVVVS
jgi:hypothetical protein